MIEQEEQDACDAAWADAERAERWRREDEALERSRVLTERLAEATREFQAACEKFSRFMTEYEQAHYERLKAGL